ncbi:unnamed protein product [Strongylus vulgaris]|uniref:Uncharacterized protein n=1 Tax=Strongylus vulgaris TaxID=40348 RepID=A0A3P7KTV6_STRVU|nr:unnamed protein product [Strongylus vulgaris]
MKREKRQILLTFFLMQELSRSLTITLISRRVFMLRNS